MKPFHRRPLVCLLVVVLTAGLVAGVGPGTAAALPGPFHALAPQRLMDTRSGQGGQAFGPGEMRDVVVAGVGGVPANAIAVTLNVTATEPTVGGYLSVWPSGQAQPDTSNVNFLAGQTVPNMVTVGVGAGGRVSVFNALGNTQVLVDVTGWFESGFTGVRPVRLMDTRAGLGGGAFSAQQGRSLVVAGVGGIPANAVAVAINVTATNPSLGGFLTVWPAGAARPGSSNLNMGPGQTVANVVLVGVGPGGQISVYNDTGTTDVLIDVMGWFAPGGGFTGLSPSRILDTRSASCGIALAAGETRTLTVTGVGGVPATGVGAVALNVTATNASQTSYLTVWPSGQARPNTSNLNMVAGVNVANMVAVGVGAAGQINIFNAGGSVDAIVDMMGYFDGDVPGGTIVACPPVSYSFGPGIHVVGRDFPPGRYAAPGGTSCYWERLRGFSGSLADIIANDIVTGPVIVDIKAGDVGFNSESGCGTWRTFHPTGAPASSFTDGVWAIGTQVIAGRYQTTGVSQCYWARLSGFGGGIAEILANNNASGTVLVDISPTDTGIESAGCGTWTRIG